MAKRQNAMLSVVENMKSLKQIGVENVESSLVEAISQVANISVLRISQFLVSSC